MAPPNVNLINFESVDKTFGKGMLLDGVSLGVAAGERIGVVGRNGGGKSTLLKVLAGLEKPDSGRVTHANHLRLGVLAQAAQVPPETTIRDFVLQDRVTHEWSSDATTRATLTTLLGGFEDAHLERTFGSLSGGERRRCELAALLLDDLDLLLLDEPTNHLDVEAVAWLAQTLKARRSMALVVVTHDRWFLDEVSDRTWEVVDGSVEAYDGGYSAYVLARAERSRQSAAEQARRNNLIRKELAWLRRGAPARTSKPKFRIDAANELIADEPPARDSVELLAFSGARLGKTVYELDEVSLKVGVERKLTILDDVTWNVGPGDRIGIVGPNGAGKTSLLRVLTGAVKPDTGKVKEGVTVKVAYLSQHVEEIDPSWRVLQAVERVATSIELSKGKSLSASQLCERLGFGPESQWTPVGDLSGGERRRLQLTRLLMDGPNVLILDEPTNDFDVETLASLEDLLDSFAGTMLVVSHDRYFLERVCDTFVAVLGNGAVRDLPRGVDEYLQLRDAAITGSSGGAIGGTDTSRGGSSSPGPTGAESCGVGLSAARQRELRKESTRLERVLSKLDKQRIKLLAEIAENATDHELVTGLHAKVTAVEAEQRETEHAWMEAAELLEQ